MDIDDSDTNSQPDQYARDNCLSIDSQVDPFSLAFQINQDVPRLTPDAGSNGLTGDLHLAPFQLPIIDVTERFDVTEDSSVLVARALQCNHVDMNSYEDAPLAQYENRKRLFRLRLDLPTLSSDPDFDCRELARTIQKQRQPNINPGMFPPERLDLNNDEGLDFPASARQFRPRFDCMVSGEKLDVPKETIHHLARALRNDWSRNEQCNVLEEQVPRRTFARDLVVTPPLIPCIEDYEHFIPDGEVCEIPFASDISSMLSDDLEKAEYVVLQKEFKKAVSPVLDVETPVLSPLLDAPEIGKRLPKIGSIRIESPLSPVTSPLQAHDEENTRIPALLRSMDTDHVLSYPKHSEKGALKANAMSVIFDQILEDEMKKDAAAVVKSIEQEHISIADAIARVEVPIMDFSISEPEWQKLPMNPNAHLKWVFESHGIVIPPYPKESRADSKLRWVPFSYNIDLHALTKEVSDCDDTSLSQYLVLPEAADIPTSANYVWKQPGLSILRESESEDLDSITSLENAKSDLASLARKRRLENGLVGIEMSLPPSSDEPVDLVVPSQPQRPFQKSFGENLPENTVLLPSKESNSAVSVLLSNHINMRTAKRRKQDKSSFFLPTSGSQVERKFEPTSRPPQTKRGTPNLYERAELSQKKAALLAPYPMTNISSTPTKLIKGLTLSRRLFSTLEQLYPTAKIIERDFSRWNTISHNVHPVSRSHSVSSFTDEADIIVSPATGIIITTLLKAIQKPLPASGGQSSIRERIACVALRYERLMVLVSEGNIMDETMRDFTPSETLAYSEFTIFATSLETRVEVFYVRGGETTLARWLVSFAVRYASEAVETQECIVEDETKWEVFLRQAGFNAYAAQAILVRLNTRNNDSRKEIDCTYHGLAVFMAMTDDERMQNFRNLMGGENVLNRVNRTLRTTWS
ncbi:hypothetical protein F5Y03DRAFT_408406 [Xylaria venustula]|nr:hypothetical protein F5Y03DRAFT_408406 [Xylaria venustula]